jgi:hypothetical protein
MAKGQEESDGRMVPKGRRKPVSTVVKRRGGKATTASQQTGQLELIRETADSPEGADGRTDTDHSASVLRAVPKSRSTKRNVLPAMTMEEVASEIVNFKKASPRCS